MKMRRKFIGLACVLAGLLAIGSCRSGEAISLDGCGPHPDCQFVAASDIASPSGQYHAISGTRICKYRGTATPGAPEVIVTGLEGFGNRSDTKDQPAGVNTFNAWRYGGNDALPLSASELKLQWRGDSDLIIWHPAGWSSNCIQPPKREFTVHCVESRGSTK